MGVKVSSKNLIPYPYAETTKIVDDTLTFTDNGDGTITANGTATNLTDFILAYNYPIRKGMLISGAPEGQSDSTFEIQAYLDADNFISSVIGLASNTDYVAPNIRIRIRGGATLNNVVFKPQLELGSTATAYTPYVSDLTAVKVTRQGKNLFSGLTKGIGIDLTTIDEIVNSNYSATDYIPVDFNANTYYYISGLPSTISNCIFAYNTNKEFLGRTGGNPLAERKLSNNSFANGTPQGTGDIAYLRVTCFKISTSAGTIDDIDDAKIQLEIGSTATDYEPYNSATFTPITDGTVNGVTSLYPNTTLTTDTDGVLIDCEYNVDLNSTLGDINTALDSIIEMQNSLIGGN